LIFRESGEIIGGAAIVVKSVPVFDRGVAFVKWGPVWRKTGQPANSDNLVKILNILVEEYCDRRKMHLTIMPPADPGYSAIYCKVLDDLGFKNGGNLVSPERYLVNTSLSSDDLFASLSQKWRYNTRKSRKNDMEIDFAPVEEGMEALQDLYWQMTARKSFLDSSPFKSLPDLMKTGSDAIRPKIVLVHHEGTVTAGGVFQIAGDRATYLFGATDDRALKLNAGYAMHWWIAERLCAEENIKWYDLGGNDQDAGLCTSSKQLPVSGSIRVWQPDNPLLGAIGRPRLRRGSHVSGEHHACAVAWD